jgi:carbonic anhydrase
MRNNASFVKELEPEKMSHMTQKKLAIVTCMDTRLTGFLEPTRGIGRGDVKIFKNAGNTAVDRDVISRLQQPYMPLALKNLWLLDIMRVEWQMLTLKNWKMS